MTTTALFLDLAHKLTFQKIAMPVKLSDAPEAWQREIASEIYKQVPSLSDYAVNIVIDRVDPERGFAFGSALITNKGETSGSVQQDLPSVRIPLIVKERMLMPMDVFMDGKGVFPLTPMRLREHLFRTDTFEMSSRKPSDQGMTSQLYPPTRSSGGFGGMGDDVNVKTASLSGSGEGAALGALVGTSLSHLIPIFNDMPENKKRLGLERVLTAVGAIAGGIGGAFIKSANPAEAGRIAAIRRMKAEAAANTFHFDGDGKEASLVGAIAHTIPEVEADEFVQQISSDPALSAAAAKNESFSKLAMTIASTPRRQLQKSAAALVRNISPTVIQFEKQASGNFKVKWANPQVFAPQESIVPPQEAVAMAGTDKILEMGPGGTMMVSTNKAQKSTLEEESIVQISEFGQWKVQNADSNEFLVGHIIPVMDFDMQPLEMYIFTNGKVYACQDEIAGTRVGHDTNLPFGDAPEGDGVFVHITESSARCLLPMTIHNTAQSPDGSLQYIGENIFGEPVTLVVAQGLQALSQLGDFEWAMPDSFHWLPLHNSIFLAKQPLDISNIAAAQQAPTAVEVQSSGRGEFSLNGAPVEKLAVEQRHFIKRAQAEFLLVGMGVSPLAVDGILGRAQIRGHVKLAGLRTIVPLADVHKAMVKKAARSMTQLPYELRRNLVKEAAIFEDAETADKILALNFINPENVSIFATYLPKLDETASKLAEMLVAARLGLRQIDEGAVERAMKNLEVVIDGLKMLQQQLA